MEFNLDPCMGESVYVQEQKMLFAACVRLFRDFGCLTMWGPEMLDTTSVASGCCRAATELGERACKSRLCPESVRDAADACAATPASARKSENGIWL